MRPIFRRCSARGAFVRNTRTMVQPAIEHALGLMLGACSFLLVGFDHACPRFARLELGPCHACPRFGSRLGSCLSPIRPARAWPMSCLSPIRISTRIMPVPDSARLELGPRHACPRFGSRLTDTRPTRPGAPPGQARRSSHRHSRRRSMSPIRPEAPRDRVRPALRLD